MPRMKKDNPVGRPKSKKEIGYDPEEDECLDVYIPESVKIGIDIAAARYQISISNFVMWCVQMGVSKIKNEITLSPVEPDTTTVRLQVLIPVNLKRDLDKIAERFGITTTFLSIYIFREILPQV